MDLIRILEIHPDTETCKSCRGEDDEGTARVVLLRRKGHNGHQVDAGW